MVAPHISTFPILLRHLFCDLCRCHIFLRTSALIKTLSGQLLLLALEARYKPLIGQVDKTGQDGQVDQDSKIDQDGQNQEPNDQPSTIYISCRAGTGCNAGCCTARTNFSTFEDQRQQKFCVRGFRRLPSLFSSKSMKNNLAKSQLETAS